jgi:C4-dicarboxylate-specific signal transduction histidine kinase
VTSKELGYYFSYPVKDINKNILGVLVLKLDPKVVENFINLSNVDWNYSNILLVDEYGVVIFSNNKDFIYKSIVKLSESELEEIDLKQRFLGVDIASINNYGLNKSDLYLENNYERLIDIKNKNKIFLFSEVESTPFFIVIDKNRDIIFEDIKKTSRILALFVFFAALFAALVIKFIVSKFLSPLITLNKIMEEASIEDLTSKIRLDCDDEVCGLVKNFNKMIEKLKNELELSKKSVSERTTQLEEINRVMTGRELKMIELKKELFDLKNK